MHGIIQDIRSYEELDQQFNAEEGLILDIRSKKNDGVRGLENAISLDLMSQNFMEFFADVKKETPLLLYCDDGSRSRVAIRILAEMGYQNLYHLKQGINRWEEKHF